MQSILLGAIALGLLWSMTTVGLYLSYRVLDIADLTVEGSIVLGASVAAVVISQGGSPIVATFAAMGGGMLAGLATGLLHTIMKIPALLAGILSMIGLYSVNLRVMKTSNISLTRMPTIFTKVMDLGFTKNTTAILTGVFCVAIVIGVIYWFLNTEMGFAVRATGNNPQMARAQGVNTSLTIIIGLVLSNGLVGLSGGLIAQFLGFSDIQMGIGSIAIGLASLIISEVLFSRGRGILWTLVSMVLGSIVYRIIIAMVFEMGMPTSDLKFFTAVTVALALYLPHIKGEIQLFQKKKRGRKNASVK